MKVSELKKLLRTMDDDLDVVLASDPEGNGYAPMRLGWVARFHEGDVYDPTDEEEYEYMQNDLDIKDPHNFGTKSLVLVPRW